MATTQIKDGFNGGSDNQLKVNSDGSINVDVSGGGSGGNVNIFDSAGNPLASSGGALDVNVVSGVTGTPIRVYNEITSVAMNSTATILTYTVPVGHTLAMNKIEVSSDSISTIEVDFNAAANAKGRLCYTNYNLNFGYNSFLLMAGTIIAIIGTNNSLQGAASFNAALQGVLN